MVWRCFRCPARRLRPVKTMSSSSKDLVPKLLLSILDNRFPSVVKMWTCLLAVCILAIKKQSVCSLCLCLLDISFGVDKIRHLLKNSVGEDVDNHRSKIKPNNLLADSTAQYV